LHKVAKKFWPTGRIRHWADVLVGPVITVLVSVAAMAQALKVWQWRPGDPIDLTGDSISGLAQIKDLLDHGWPSSNPDLGAPFHQDASWFPYADQLHLFLTGKVVGLFSNNPFTVSAIYFFLGFPLAALSMYWLARQRHLGRAGSVVAGVLFSILPGHQTMFEHLWLASYWVVPLGMWLVLRFAMGEPLFRVNVAWRDPISRRPALLLNLTTAFCVLCIAIGGIYYAAFTLLLLAVIALVRLVATRDRATVLKGALLLFAIGAVSLTALASVAAGQDKSALVTAPAQRDFSQSEQLAGKLMDLILPWIHHRVNVLQYLTATYNSRTTPTLEEPALGVIALAGVVALLVIMMSTLIPQRVKPANRELGVFALLALAAISFFIIGGLGSLFALFVTPQIRTWSRIFVIIGLFGLLAVGRWVTVLGHRNRILGFLAATALIAIGVLDQTNPALAPDYKSLRTEVADLTTFSQSTQTKVGSGCSVFQLPVVPYPENPPVHDMTDYAHLRPYLTSSSLRWSYGAFRGTSLADWQLALPQKSTPALVDDLVATGFCAVEVDRAGFADRGASLSSEFTALLGKPISTTTEGRLVAWDLRQARDALTARVGVEQVTATGDLVLHPVLVYSDQGAYTVQQDNQTPYQWTGPSPEIDVHNFGRTTTNGVHLSFSLAAPNSGPRRFTIHSPGGSMQKVDVSGGSTRRVQLVINALPGRNPVTITITGTAASAPKVSGKIVFGKLIDVQAYVSDPRVHVGVVQQFVD
jgi:hypothetical protein